MTHTERMGEVLGLVGTINPASYAAGTQATEAFDLTVVKGKQLLIMVTLGAVGAAGKLDFKLQSSPVAGAPSWTDIPGTSITQMATADKVQIISVKLDGLWNTLTPAQQLQTKVQGLATITTNAVLADVKILAGNGTFNPMSDANLAKCLPILNIG